MFNSVWNYQLQSISRNVVVDINPKLVQEFNFGESYFLSDNSIINRLKVLPDSVRFAPGLNSIPHNSVWKKAAVATAHFACRSMPMGLTISGLPIAAILLAPTTKVRIAS